MEPLQPVLSREIIVAPVIWISAASSTRDNVLPFASSSARRKPTFIGAHGVRRRKCRRPDLYRDQHHLCCGDGPSDQRSLVGASGDLRDSLVGRPGALGELGDRTPRRSEEKTSLVTSTAVRYCLPGGPRSAGTFEDCFTSVPLCDEEKRMKLRRVLGIAAAGLVMATLTGATGSVQAAKHKHPHAARYQAGARSHTARRICFVVRYHTPPRAPRTVCRPVGGYSRLTAHEGCGVRPECRRRPKISGRILTFPRRLSMTGRLRLPIRVGDLHLVGGALPHPHRHR